MTEKNLPSLVSPQGRDIKQPRRYQHNFTTVNQNANQENANPNLDTADPPHNPNKNTNQGGYLRYQGRSRTYHDQQFFQDTVRKMLNTMLGILTDLHKDLENPNAGTLVFQCQSIVNNLNSLLAQ